MNNSPTIRLALFQPDIPQNTAAVLRTCACLGVSADIIGPAGFLLDGARVRRAGMDYLQHVSPKIHDDWPAFQITHTENRTILLTTKAVVAYTDFQFKSDDIVLFGRESAGVPDYVHEAVGARLLIPMAPHVRSLNLAQSVAIVLGEALRQLDAFPKLFEGKNSSKPGGDQ